MKEFVLVSNALHLSTPEYDRILKVSRTVADLESLKKSAPRTSLKRLATVHSLALMDVNPGAGKMLLRLRKFNIFWVG